MKYKQISALILSMAVATTTIAMPIESMAAETVSVSEEALDETSEKSSEVEQQEETVTAETSEETSENSGTDDTESDASVEIETAGDSADKPIASMEEVESEGESADPEEALGEVDDSDDSDDWGPSDGPGDWGPGGGPGDGPGDHTDHDLIEGTWKKEENGKWRYYTSETEYLIGQDAKCHNVNGTGEKNWYRFDNDGYLVLSSWVSKDPSETYYVGEDGEYVTGIQEIDGEKYFFYEDGRHPSSEGAGATGDTWVVWGRTGIVISEEQIISGKVYENDGQLYCYEKNSETGELEGYEGIASYGEDEYCFSNGRVAQPDGIGAVEYEGFFCFYNWEGKVTEKKKIEPYKWITISTYHKQTYYYILVPGESGSTLQRVTGFYEIDGQCYAFNDDGELKNYSDKTYKDGKLYVWNDKGIVTGIAEVELNKIIEIGGKKYYFTGFEDMYDGEHPTGPNGLTTIDGNKYFLENGEIQTGFQLDYYSHDEGSRLCYLDPETGIAQTGWVKKHDKYDETHHTRMPNVYFMDEDGYAITGWSDDGQYFFDRVNKCMLTGTWLIDGEICTFGIDGKLQKKNPATDGWNEIGDDKYYLKDGEIVANQFVEIDGQKYLLDENGMLVAPGITNYLGQHDGPGDMKNVWVKEDRSIATSEWVSLGQGENAPLAYADENGYLLSGWQTLDGNTYYFSESETGHYMITGKAVISGHYYEFTEDGKYIGELDIPDGLYFASNYKKTADGTYEPIVEQYYGEDGKNIYGWMTIDDDIYYFDGWDGPGESMQDRPAVTATEKWIDGENYVFDADAKLVRNGWAKISMEYNPDRIGYVYADSKGVCLTGWQEIDGEKYFFDTLSGFRVENLCDLNDPFGNWNNEDHDWQLFDSEGRWIKNYNNGQRIQIGSDLYSLGDRGWTEKDGKTYYVSNDQKVLRDCIYEEVPFETNLKGTALPYKYYLKSDGSLAVNEEITYDGIVYKADETGVLTEIGTVSELLEKNKKLACVELESKENVVALEIGALENLSEEEKASFDAAAEAALEEAKAAVESAEDEEAVAAAKAEGIAAIQQALTDAKAQDEKNAASKLSGWNREDGKWYYYKNGDKQTGWLNDHGKWYYMDASGVMTTGWQKVNGKWYYMNTSGAMTTGWQKVNNKWYYMNTSGAMVTGNLKIGNKTYRFNTSGACLNP